MKISRKFQRSIFFLYTCHTNPYMVWSQWTHITHKSRWYADHSHRTTSGSSGTLTFSASRRTRSRGRRHGTCWRTSTPSGTCRRRLVRASPLAPPPPNLARIGAGTSAMGGVRTRYCLWGAPLPTRRPHSFFLILKFERKHDFIQIFRISYNI